MSAAALRLGTRGSPLALRQAGLMAAELERRGRRVDLVVIRTSGDVLAGSLAPVGGKGLFVKEIEEALLDGRIDCAVHSLKDVPAVLPAGLALVAIPPREDARDVLVLPAAAGDAPAAPGGAASGRVAAAPGLAALPPGARVGTASLRRRAQILERRPDVMTVALRGNVDTRLRKLAAGEADALVLAAAGLRRLGLAPAGAVPLAPEEVLPAIGQGALALEARVDDRAVTDLLRMLDHAPTAAAVAAERALLVAIGGDCQTPVAAHATIDGTRLRLRALVAEVDGSAVLRGEVAGAAGDAAALGSRLGAELLARGADAILTRARAGAPAPEAP